MDRKWLDRQVEELGEALAQQNLALAVPDLFESTFKAKIESNLARLIDHTLLKPDATKDEIKSLCQEAIEYQFASVCVNPKFVAFAYECLQNSVIKIPVCTVVGFPLGANTTLVKVLETRDAIANGATEIDMVLAISSLKEKDYAAVYQDIAQVVEAAGGNIVKVILETCYLTKEEIVKASVLARMAGASFVKTSTGFGSYGALAEDVALMRRVVGESMGVKASGGIRDRSTALQMIEAGATRIGASKGVEIVTGKPQSKSG